MWHFCRTCVLFAIASPMFLRAQANLSTLRGTVQDPGGAMVGDASVNLVNVETNFKRSVLTNSSGDYEIPQLKPGTYRLIANHPGFQELCSRKRDPGRCTDPASRCYFRAWLS